MMRKRICCNMPCVIPQVYYYQQPNTMTNMPLVNNEGQIVENPNDQRFGGFLLPALGGFLVGSIVPRPWGNNFGGPMYGYPVQPPVVYTPYPNVTTYPSTVPYTNPQQ